ncbi:MAG TPA: sulfurtransferase [Candidatus Limnocylindrales bacterium]|nr:sulfurtransferase [Candidatus Limnocylindrales bacterium]
MRHPARPSPLISVDELAARLGLTDLVVVDARWVLGKPGEGRADYDAGHVPGAIHLDLDADLASPTGFGAPGRHPLPTPDEFAARMGAVGIGDDTFVVAYDDAGGWIASRLWWMLDNLGHDAPGRGGAAVLDGGWKAWRAAGLPVSSDPVPALRARTLHVLDRWTRIIARDDLRDRLGTLVLLDARAPARYRGETEPIDPVAGHIPTARSAPWDLDVGPDGRLLPPDELRRRLGEIGLGGKDEVVTSCGSGTSATLHILAARVAGLPDPTLYVGSYSDWSRSEWPVVSGAEPGSPADARA